MHKQYLNFICIQIWLIPLSVTQTYEGDLCLQQKLNKEGRCELIHDCPSALDGLKRGNLPETCGFNGNTPIVCCVESATLPITTTTATTKTTSTTRKTTPSSRLQFNSFFGSPDGNIGRKSYEKCREYAKYVNVSYVVPGFKRVRYRNTCGIKARKLIVGGTKVESAKEFPHMAAIGFEDGDTITYKCGGSLISELFVLSAAHCAFQTSLGAAKFVRLGVLSLISEENETVQDFNITETIKHPGFSSKSKYNDIVLFKLEREVTINAYVRPICLPIYKEPPTEKAVATGWGRYSINDDYLSDDLLKVTLVFYTQSNCNALFGVEKGLNKGILEASQICAGSNETKDACEGDSGGPLQIYHEDPEAYCMYVLIGVISFGKDCALPPFPGVYTRVQNYLEWIESNVWP